MSQFDTMFNAIARPRFMDGHGRAIAVHHENRDPVTVTAIVGHVVEQEDIEAEVGGRSLRKFREVTVSTDATDGITDLGKMHVFEIDGHRWSVRSILRRADGMVTAECIRVEAMEKSRRGYRTEA